MRRHAVRFLVMIAAAALPALLRGQEVQVVKGHVTAAETSQPLPSVRVTVKGTAIGTYTDRDGRFTLQAPPNATTLVFAHIGFKRVEVAVGSDMEVVLEQRALALEGVVVTALGVEREKRSLGYSVQELQGDQLAAVPKVNIVNALQGQVAGVQITDAGPTGGSARIVIRGASSIEGNNQPLFVVDGIPVDNSGPRNTGFGGIDYGNAVQDIDAANIASMSVLKGPNAAALYGARAANGAIVITTRSAKTSPAFTISSSLTTEQPLRLPSYQNAYGQGYGDGRFQWVDGRGGGIWDDTDESWGPKLDGRLIDQFTGPQQPWLPHPDNVRSFFRTGKTWNTNVAVSQSTERANVRLSLTNSRVDGMAPGNVLTRRSLAVKGGASISDRISTEASLNYLSQDGDDRPGTGYDPDNPMQSFGWFGRQVDMNALRHYTCDAAKPTRCIAGGQYNWNYNYHNNPFWEQLVNTNGDERDRLLGHVQVSYHLNDWITATGRIGRDWYREHRKDVTAFHSLDDAGDGGFNESTIYRSETNADLLVAGTRQVTSDFTVGVTGGGNIRENRYDTTGVAVTALAAPDIYTIDNALVAPNPLDYTEHKKVRSLYGLVSLNYRGYLNLDASGRSDWSSTLPGRHNAYFYPSVSAAFVFSDALNLRNRILSSGKLRASWARVGNDTDPYRLRPVFIARQAWGSQPMFATPDTLLNPDLRPEQTASWEVGADLGFLNERLGFVLTRYDRTTRDQIVGVRVSATSGYTNQVLNAGKVRNYGWELLLQATPLRLRNGFTWDMTLNWARNHSQVRELYGNLQTLVLSSYWSLDIEARGPQRDASGNIVGYYGYGTLFGNGYLRDAQGRWMLNARGLPRVDPVRRVLGNYNPDWNGGIENRFSYGPFELSVQVDGQMGGKLFSTTKWFGEYSGVLASTLRGRENDYCDPGIVVRGVLPDGSVNGDGVNDVRVCPMDYFHANFGNHEAGIVDRSYLKLREARLTYQLPARVASRLGFSGGEVALIGRNLFLLSKADNIDPETAFDASNVQGIEYGQFPTARSLGFAISFRR